MVEWQTRQTQNLLRATLCRFKSGLRDQYMRHGNVSFFVAGRALRVILPCNIEPDRVGVSLRFRKNLTYRVVASLLTHYFYSQVRPSGPIYEARKRVFFRGNNIFTVLQPNKTYNIFLNNSHNSHI